MNRRNNQVAELLERAAAAQREADGLCAQAVALVRQRHTEARTRDGIIRRCYPARPTSVPLARAAVARVAARSGMSQARLDAVRLAVSEAMTNALIHAYPERSGLIHLTAALAEDELTVLIADDGIGPRARPQRPGAGWGWALISNCSDELTITERGTGGTLVEIRWQLGAGSGQNGASPALTARDRAA